VFVVGVEEEEEELSIAAWGVTFMVLWSEASRTDP